MLRMIALATVLTSCSDYNLQHPSDEVVPTDDDTRVDDENPDADGDGVTDGDDPAQTDPGSAGITGRICDPSGDGWVVDAYVWASIDEDGNGTEDSRAEDYTDAEGRFELLGLKPGPTTVHAEKGSYSATFQVDLVDGQVYELAEEECLDPESVEIAVISGQYDDIGAVLTDMGLPYDKYNGMTFDYLDLLGNPSLMASYDIIFFNCGIVDYWLFDENTYAGNIKNYVQSGGSIYSSDWAYYLVEASFPNMLDFYGDDNTAGAAYVGTRGSLTGEVVDSNIEAVLGSNQAELNYDLPSWVVPTGAGAGVEVLVKGSPRVDGEVQSNVPLAARYHDGGTVIYTSFHNEAQITSDMEAILNEVILSL